MVEIFDMKGKPIPKEVIDAVNASAVEANKPWINPVVVSMLEEYLEAAKQGTILSFAIAAVRNDGLNVQTYVCAPNTNFHLHSSVVVLEKRIARYVETGRSE